jgi:3-oxoacyl-[acyl-carrier-protein] synthase-3
MLHSNVCLEALAYELPPHVVATSSLYERLAPTLKRLGIPGSWLAALSGVEERRFWEPGTFLPDMASRAGRKALERSGLAADQIGCVINTSVYKDFLEPSVACMVHHDLGLPEEALNFDIANACLAFLSGISMVARMIDAGEIKAGLVVDAECSRSIAEETMKRLTRPDIDLPAFSNEFAALTLGSGAVAAVLTHRSISRTTHRVVGHVSLADTNYCKHCIGRASEMITDQTRLMKGGVELAARTWALAARTFGWTRDNIKQFICHQVGARHHKLLFETLGLDPQRAFQTFPFLGNVGPASVPLTLAMAEERGHLKPGDRVGLMGIGSGLNCAMMEIVW